jgi:cytoskeletal protein CcmA (bactofilin family)
MLTKNPDGLSAVAGGVASAQRQTARGSSSVIGAGLTITGNLECKGELHIDGKVEGEIRARRIIIGQGAHTTGNLVAEAVEVRGGVQGSIRGNAVAFQSSSRVEADVFHNSLTIEQGAFFEGKSRRSDDPMAGQQGANTILPTR